MPTKRRKVTRAAVIPEYDMAVRVHLELGDCLLAGYGDGCGCGLINFDGVFQEDVARAMWRAHRDEILAGWDKPEPPWGSRFDDE